MLVCPNCRSENAEGAQVCEVCGRSLVPGETPFRRIEREEEAPGDDVAFPTPKPPKRWPVAVALSVIVLGSVAGGIWFANRPEPCDGKFVSRLYPYCVAVPVGWTAATSRTPTGALDRFEPESEGAAIIVRAGEAIPGTTTIQYAQGIRQTQEAHGVALGPVQTIQLGDGSEAFAWQAAMEFEDGSILQQRIVALVRDGIGWRIALGGDTENFDEARFAFEELLATWDWNDPA